MNYRSYIIEPSTWFAGKYNFFMEGDFCQSADSIEEAKELIDEAYLRLDWKVKVVPHTEPVRFDWLSDAMKFIRKHKSAVPLFEFDAP